MDGVYATSPSDVEALAQRVAHVCAEGTAGAGGAKEEASFSGTCVSDGATGADGSPVDPDLCAAMQAAVASAGSSAMSSREVLVEAVRSAVAPQQVGDEAGYESDAVLRLASETSETNGQVGAKESLHRALATVFMQIPGAGAQPGPRATDIQCIQGEKTDRGALYISGGASVNKKNLEKLGIGRVVRFGRGWAAEQDVEKFLADPEGNVMTIDVLETETADEDIDSGKVPGSLPRIVNYIRQGLVRSPEEGGSINVLVHCDSGVSLSGAAAVAFLVWDRETKGMSVGEALQHVRVARPYVRLSREIQRQLELFRAEQRVRLA